MTVREAIVQSAEDLQRRVVEHQRLLGQYTDEDAACSETCLMLDCPCRQKLRRTVSESIERVSPAHYHLDLSTKGVDIGIHEP